ncbi:MAG: glycosyltransferase family 2 protein [Bacilli bacterium]|nr:glycosyltransferase family 2 protein [Bacilli bacterium]
MKDKMKCTIIIPSLNPNNKLLLLVDNLLKSGFDDIIVINDGSSKEYDYIYNKLSKNIKIIKHEVNLGKGSSIKDAIKLIDNSDAFITVDSDGQHLVEDVIKVSKELKDKDIVLGERNFKEKCVPFKSKFGNGFSRMVFKFRTGISLNDTQTGLRGINIKYKKLALETEGNRYEYEMNFLYNLARNNIKINTVSINTIYECGNKGSHFNVIRDSLLIHRCILIILLTLIILLILSTVVIILGV